MKISRQTYAKTLKVPVCQSKMRFAINLLNQADCVPKAGTKNTLSRSSLVYRGFACSKKDMHATHVALEGRPQIPGHVPFSSPALQIVHQVPDRYSLCLFK
jgi:hypothetical protein